MAVVTTKSASIISWDSTPIVEATTGEGSPGFLKSVNDFVTGVAGDSIASFYRMVRIPTNAKVKRVLLTTKSITVAAGDINVGFSDSLVDGTPPSLSSLADPVVKLSGPVDNKLFGAAQTLAGPLNNTDVTFTNTFTPAHQNLPLWQVLVNLLATQFTTDPGGYFDIIIKLTAAVTVGGPASIEVDFVE